MTSLLRGAPGEPQVKPAEKGKLMSFGKIVSRQCLLIALLAPVFADAAEPKRGGSLKFGMSQNLTSLNPFLNLRGSDHKVRSLMYEGLLTYSRNLESLPGLAVSWEISSDGLTYSFVVRPGAKFHNGKALTPEDIKWSIGYAQDPKNSTFGRADLTIIKEVEIVDPDRIRIQLKSPFAPFRGSNQSKASSGNQMVRLRST
jgi:peptide/nickel transport system substrate-binding protein